jgi:hypothetical protein
MQNRKLAAKISELNDQLRSLTEERDSIRSLRDELIRQTRISWKSVSLADFDKLRRNDIAYSIKVNKVVQDLQSLELLQAFTRQTPPAFERIIIGAGVAGTSLFAELPQHLRYKTNGDFPAVLVLNDPVTAHQWPQDGCSLMGQPGVIQTPPNMSSHAEDFFMDEHIDTTRNPYNYTLAHHFNYALIETQNDLNMQILNLKAVRIDTWAKLSSSGSFSSSSFYQGLNRIIVSYEGSEFPLYTSAIDLCVGPGQTLHLEETQVTSELSKKLIAEHRLIYGQYEGDADLCGDVVFYGGGARSATMALDVALGAKPNAKLKYWVSRNGGDFRDTGKLSRMYNDIYEMDDSLAPKRANTLVKVEQRNDDRLKLHFTVPKQQQSDKHLPEIKDEDVVCDHLVVAIGQVRYPLTDNLSGFVPTLYANDKLKTSTLASTDIPLGTRSLDGTIIVWGAAGSTGIGLSSEMLSSYVTQARAHGYTLPPESQAAPSIFRSTWTIIQQAKQLRNSGFFPKPDKKRDLSLDYTPNINLANLVDLKEHLTEELAAEIIAYRSKTILGIQTLKQLAAAVPGLSVKDLKALRSVYFRFDGWTDLPVSVFPPKSEPVLVSQPKLEMLREEDYSLTAGQAHSAESKNEAGSLRVAEPLRSKVSAYYESFFAKMNKRMDKKEIPDSYAFISAVTNTDNDATESEQPVLPPVPSIVRVHSA